MPSDNDLHAWEADNHGICMRVLPAQDSCLRAAKHKFGAPGLQGIGDLAAVFFPSGWVFYGDLADYVGCHLWTYLVVGFVFRIGSLSLGYQQFTWRRT